MVKKLAQDIAKFIQEIDRRFGKIGGKPSLETMAPGECSEQEKMAATASAQTRREED